MTCHRLLVYQSLIASLPLRANKARSSYFALDCVAKNPVSFVVRPDLINLDWVRLALPRSPESGVAVSTAGKILSREKRKMWMRFSQSAHILWCVFHATSHYRGEILSRNVQQISRNSFMRNLLTALPHNRNRKVPRETFFRRFRTFSTAHR
jgi:hypothetical protein